MASLKEEEDRINGIENEVKAMKPANVTLDDYIGPGK